MIRVQTLPQTSAKDKTYRCFHIFIDEEIVSPSKVEQGRGSNPADHHYLLSSIRPPPPSTQTTALTLAAQSLSYFHPPGNSGGGGNSGISFFSFDRPGPAVAAAGGFAVPGLRHAHSAVASAGLSDTTTMVMYGGEKMVVVVVMVMAMVMVVVLIVPSPVIWDKHREHVTLPQ